MIKIENCDIDNILVKYKVLFFKWFKIGFVDDNGNKIENKFESEILDKTNQYQIMMSFVYDKLDYLIEAKHTEFNHIIKEFNNTFRADIDHYYGSHSNVKATTDYGRFKNKMEYFYKYLFSSDSKLDENKKLSFGNWLTQRLGVNVCPYCNRQYTFTITSVKSNTRPQFDHFKPKSKYPFLALSFYNLVPSCPTCNHLKSNDEVEYHPYEKGFEDNYKFMLKTKNNKVVEKGNYKIKLCNIDNKTNTNIDVLGLTMLYEGHRDYVDEILDKAQAYNCAYYNSLINSYTGLGKQPSEIDQFIWGIYLEEAEHCKRPLSKLTRDILEQLKIK